ncbi:hypothetical protein [Nitratireductor indicus]|uniref:hypothetical protein n=1 Tax=Nitratireductor indicus TaxID=721133 RepID=UPI002875D74B|nr:hypothetical protein [Nitratireductor indicus]MDS1138593.1 hypothetical protein [Nitratireductor indicus]
MACSKQAMECSMIAKAIYAGATVSEVSEEFNRSIGFVLEQTRKYEKKMEESRRRVMARRQRLEQRMKQKKKEPAPLVFLPYRRVKRLKSAIGRELGILAVEERGKPTMPYVAILHGPIREII